METIKLNREVMACAEVTPQICFADARMLGDALQRTADEICLKIESMLSKAYDQGIKLHTISAKWTPQENEADIGSFHIFVRGSRDSLAESPQPI